MNFYDILNEVIDGYAVILYSSKINDEWQKGYISIDFLNEHFSQCTTAEEMINATESEGLKLYFAWLRDEGILN